VASLYSVLAYEAARQSRGFSAVAPAVRDPDHGVHHTGQRDDGGGACLLQTHGPKVRQGQHAAIAFLLQDGCDARPSASHQIFLRLQFRACKPGGCPRFAGNSRGGIFSGIRVGDMGFRYARAARLSSGYHFHPANLIVFLPSI